MSRTIIILSLTGLSFLSWTAADTFFERLKQKFEDFNNTTTPRTLELFFNQTQYAPGDTVFFRVNLLHANGSTRIGREMVQVVVSDTTGTPLLRHRFVIQDGAGSHYFLIPQEINPGVYALCGYTNSSADPLLSTQITVVRDHGFVSRTSTVEVQFFPEGGHWVADVPVHGVMKVMGFRDTRKMSVVIHEGNKIVKQIEVEKNGLTSFELIPSLQNSWFAEITEGNVVHKIPLVVSPDGCSVHVEREHNHFVVTVAIAAASKYQNKTLYLQVANQNTLSFRKAFIVENGEDAIIQIPYTEIPAGLSQLSIFDSEFNALADELLFQEIEKLNMVISGLKDSYHNRERVDFDFSVTDAAGQSVLQSYTLTVIKKELLPEPPNFSETYAAETHDQSALITKKNLIDWPSVINTDYTLKRPSGSVGLEIKGRIFFMDTGLPVPDSTLISGILKNGLISYEAFTSGNGMFTFSFLYDFQGEDELFYVVSKDGKELHNIKVEVFNEALPDCRLEGNYDDIGSEDPYAGYSRKLREVSRAFQFNRRSSQRAIDWNYKFEDELMGADRVTTLDQFMLMPTMPEVIKEVIPSLHVRNVDGRQAVRVLLRSEEKIPPVAIDEPLYCIDGELTKNTPYFLGLNPAEVAKVKLVVEKEKLERFGMLGRNGIVIVQTKRTRPEQIPDNTIIKVRGITNSLSPHYPDYSKVNNRRIPDFRATLYFNSYNAGSNSPMSSSFYTSDDVGEYVVQIKGRTKKGEALYFEKSFSIIY